MNSLKYKVIRNKTQYKQYCNYLEHLVFTKQKTKEIKDEIDLLTVLIEKWDMDMLKSSDLDPIQLLNSFLADHKLKAKDLADILDVSKGYISDILHYKKGLSKDNIRKLSDYFSVSQEAFNRPYLLSKLSAKPNELVS